MAHWSLDDIPWHAFDQSRIEPGLVSLIKAASMVEHNGYDYARYLCEVFSDDKDFRLAAQQWAKEEVQHGQALRKWAELADPAFDFNRSFARFTTGYALPANVTASVRGSRAGELVARCMVETGTSSYYTAIRDYTAEPVLKALCAKIAADEFRHYKLFYTYLADYLKKEKLGPFQRLKLLLSRIAESEDDELAYAFYASHEEDTRIPYNRELYAGRYLSAAGRLYRRRHIDKMVKMVWKAAGLNPRPLLNRCVSFGAWHFMQWRIARLSAAAA